MEPQTYLSGEHLEPMNVPDFRQVFKNYERFDVGAVGEFDVAVLIDQYAGAQISNKLYPHWRGGYYYAVRSKGDPAAPLGLLYASRWSSPEKASNFAAIYASALGKRYLHVHDVVKDGKEPAVQDRSVRPSDWQAGLADRGRTCRHRRAGRHGHGHREPGPGHDRQAGRRKFSQRSPPRPSSFSSCGTGSLDPVRRSKGRSLSQ